MLSSSFFAHLPDFVGLSGVACILAAYYLLNAGKISSTQLPYQLLNFSGAWLILFSLFFHWNTASVVIEIAWISISTMGMVKIFKKKQASKPVQLKVVSKETMVKSF